MFESAGTLHFLILNSSDQSHPDVDGEHPVVTTVFIEDPGGVLGGGGLFDALNSVGTVDGSGVLYKDSEPLGTLQGKNNVSPSFVSTFMFDPRSPGAHNGIDPGESGSFKFNSATVAAVEAALASGTIRVGLHIQQIGTNGTESAGYILVPEPGTAFLALIGTGMLLLRRRRR